jgi:hypothetical protein
MGHATDFLTGILSEGLVHAAAAVEEEQQTVQD